MSFLIRSHIIILHADICTNFPIKEMLKFHEDKNNICTLLSCKVSNEEAKEHYCLVSDPETNGLYLKFFKINI